MAEDEHDGEVDQQDDDEEDAQAEDEAQQEHAGEDDDKLQFDVDELDEQER